VEGMCGGEGCGVGGAVGGEDGGAFGGGEGGVFVEVVGLSGWGVGLYSLSCGIVFIFVVMMWVRRCF